MADSAEPAGSRPAARGSDNSTYALILAAGLSVLLLVWTLGVSLWFYGPRATPLSLALQFGGTIAIGAAGATVGLRWARERSRALRAAAELLSLATQRALAVHTAADLLDQASQNKQILEGLPIGVFVLDAAGAPLYSNTQSNNILGRGLVSEAGIGDLAEVYRVYIAGTDELYPTDRLPVVRALAGDKTRMDDMEIRHPHRRVPVEVWGTPIFAESGEQVAALAAIVDISERKRSERELISLNADLERRVTVRTAELSASYAELEAFSYSISHDLRAPLRAMSGFATKLKRKAMEGSDPEAARYAERVVVNAERMGTLIDELLALSRLGRQDLHLVPLQPAEVARGALADLQEQVKSSHATVVINEMGECHGDPGLIQQVYANLLSNALKYSRNTAHPLVEVGSQVDASGTTVYYVKDNGAGFDMRFKDKLFGVFQRLHGADEFEGIGIGLANVKRIVTRHGGEVSAVGAPGLGATFSFTLGGTAN